MSQIVPVLHATVVGGKLKWNAVDAKRLNVLLRHMKDGVALDIVVRKHQKEVSDPQRGYYFGGLVRPIMEHTGERGEEGKKRVHNALKLMFLRDDNFVIPTVRSYAKLTTAEAEEYHASIRQWGDEFLGIYLETPDEWKARVAA